MWRPRASTLFTATTKVAAVGGHHERCAAVSGRGTSLVVFFVVAMNSVGVVALNTIYVLRLSKTGRTVRRMDSRLDGWSVGRVDNWHCCEGLRNPAIFFARKFEKQKSRFEALDQLCRSDYHRVVEAVLDNSF